MFDRSAGLPAGGYLNQCDATSWMGVYALNMLVIAVVMAQHNNAYEDIASKFFEHFLYIADAINDARGRDISLWNEEDGFYYDVLGMPGGIQVPLRTSSIVGLTPLLAVEVVERGFAAKLPNLVRRIEWFFEQRKDLYARVACFNTRGSKAGAFWRWQTRSECFACSSSMLDGAQFLSPHGIRSLSKYHEAHPYVLELEGMRYEMGYEPAESKTGLFGGNSNWRGPVWFPINYLIIESLQRFHRYYGDDLKIEYPTGSGTFKTLWDVAEDLSGLIAIFLPDENGKRPVNGARRSLQHGSALA